ncbi:hypothetical protein [Achromobacter sp. DH1f]|uniref:hypothetical protein n=1 Tax=Achromobacter sp. DH1f TaxID=1397275 RepID=UPI0012FF28D5|nr:hypothetical protein [Achromobacter sp. DH1f]
MKKTSDLMGVLTQTLKSKGAAKMGKGMPGQVLLEGFDQMYKAFGEYQALHAQEKTKRAQIQADRDVAVKNIRAQRDVVKQAMADTFDLRKTGLQAQIRAMDKAIENGDIEALHVIMDGMVRTLESSPFKDIAQMRDQLSQKDFVFELK